MAKRKLYKEKFVPMPGSRISSGQAQAAGRVFREILQEHGAVKPEMVLERAKDISCPIHNYFTWDDTLAAQKQRLAEAQSLVRSVRVIRDDMPAQEQPAVRYLLSVQACKGETRFSGNAYLPLPDIKSNGEYRRQVLQSALSEYTALERKYRDLENELGQVFKAVAKARKKMEKATA